MTMTDHEILDRAERAAKSVVVPEGRYEDLLRRRDRKRRNQRSAAGAVGIAVFAAAVWIVTMGLPLGESQTKDVPGGASTGSGGTEPAETGPWDGYSAGGALHGSIPPEGVALSSSATTELIAHYSKFHEGFVLVYADGRVVWFPWGGVGQLGEPGRLSGRVYEQRITPQGVDLVRTGAVQPRVFLGASQAEVPASIWANPEVRLYAPPRYAVCFSRSDGDPRRDVDPSRVVDLLPAPAKALLRGEGEPRSYEALGNPPTECLEVTTEEARALDEILSDADIGVIEPGTWFVRREGNGRAWIDFIDFLPLFPDRVWHALPG